MRKHSALLALVSMLFLSAASSSAQDCATCDGSQFGYPAAVGSHGGRLGSRHHARHENWEQWKSESDKIYARNAAWPKPFSCQDRMAYYSIWDTMINQGYHNHCILGAEHFNVDSNELNRAGQMKIAGIMQNLPSGRRQLFIARDINDKISQDRLASVNQVVETFYNQSAPNMAIAFTDRQLPMISGLQADAIVKGRIEGVLPPVLPVVSSGQGVRSSTTQ